MGFMTENITSLFFCICLYFSELPRVPIDIVCIVYYIMYISISCEMKSDVKRIKYVNSILFEISGCVSRSNAVFCGWCKSHWRRI